MYYHWQVIRNTPDYGIKDCFPGLTSRRPPIYKYSLQFGRIYAKKEYHLLLRSAAEIRTTRAAREFLRTRVRQMRKSRVAVVTIDRRLSYHTSSEIFTTFQVKTRRLTLHRVPVNSPTVQRP